MSTPTTRHFLNALRRNRQLPTPMRGAWHQEMDFLQMYAADIEIQGQLSNTELSHSVPSFFQRPIQFYRSLASPENPLHDAVTQEWRGLLAVFALAGWLELELEVRHFQMPDPVPNATSTVGATGNGSLHLDTILRSQAPHESDWNEWWMIYCHAKLLGATSPWTAVYTAAQYVPHESIPWQRNGLLIDPVEHYDSDRDRRPIELSILYAWVTARLARRSDWQMVGRLGVQANVITASLQAWQQELQRYADPAVNITQYSTRFEHPMLAGILREVADFPAAESDLLLKTSEPGARPVVVLSEKLPAEKRVHRGIFARDIDVNDLENEGTELVTRFGRPVKLDYIVAERLFLPEKLVALHLSPAAFHAGGSASLSVPLTPDFFRYLNHQDLTVDPNRLVITKIGGSYKVTLRLPVSGGTLSVERLYSDKDIIHLPTETPGFAIWPDFCSPAWNENFAAYAAPDKTDLIACPVFSDGSQPREEARSNAHQKDVRIWHSQKFCIGFGLKWRQGTRDISAGVVLRNTLRLPRTLNRGLPWDIGVDFGTSSTTVMVLRKGEAIPLQFKGRTVFLSEPQGDARGSLQAIENALYPASDRVPLPPFRTLLYDSAATLFNTQAANYTLRFTGNAAQDGVNTPVRNVKWGHQSQSPGGSPMMAYLQSLVRYIVCEAVDEGIEKLTLKWSFPLSLPSGSLTQMQSFWSQQVETKYSQDHGLQVHVEKKEISESEAVCRCLANASVLSVRADGLSIAVDMGGGSTDVAIWSAQKLLDQFSFKVAGNDILDPRYLDSPSIQAIFEACQGNRIPPSELDTVVSSPEIYVGGVLAEARDTNGHVIQNPRQHPVPRHILGRLENAVPWLHFRSMIYLCTTGLAYYLGMHTRIFDIPLNSIQIYIGGRGSAGLAWLSADPRLVNETLTAAFLQGLNANIQLGEQAPPKFRYLEKANITFLGSALSHDTKYPPLKTEVASGLLFPLPLKVAVEPGVRLGEVGWRVKGSQQPAPWDKRFTAEQMADLIPPEDFESSHIGNFLSWLRKDGKQFLAKLLLDDKLTQLWPSSAAIQNQIREATDGQDHIQQPVFGYEIKSLMRQYAERAASSGEGKSAGA